MSLQAALVLLGALLFAVVVVVSVVSQRPGLLRILRRRATGRIAARRRSRDGAGMEPEGEDGPVERATGRSVFARMGGALGSAGERLGGARGPLRNGTGRRPRGERREPVLGPGDSDTPGIDHPDHDRAAEPPVAQPWQMHGSPSEAPTGFVPADDRDAGVDSPAPAPAAAEVQPEPQVRDSHPAPVREPFPPPAPVAPTPPAEPRQRASIEPDESATAPWTSASEPEGLSGPDEGDGERAGYPEEPAGRRSGLRSPRRLGEATGSRRPGIFEQLARRRAERGEQEPSSAGDETGLDDEPAPGAMSRVRDRLRSLLGRVRMPRLGAVARSAGRGGRAAEVDDDLFGDDTGPTPGRQHDAGATAAAAGPTSAPVETPIGNSGDDEPALEFVARIPARAPVVRDVPLAIYRLEEYLIDRPVRVLGLSHPEGQWIDLERAEADQLVSEVAVSVQLADRNGPITESELTRFQQLAMKLADALGGGFRFSMTFEEAETRGRELDEICREYDALAVINIIALDGHEFAGPDIDRAARDCGLELGRMSIYHRPGARPAARHRYSLASLYKPGTFARDDLDSVRTRGLTLFMNIPWSSDPLATFEDMLSTARTLGEQLHGQLVDENRKPLSDAGIDAIRSQIDEIAEGMRASGIHPGSAAAARLF